MAQLFSGSSSVGPTSLENPVHVPQCVGDPHYDQNGARRQAQVAKARTAVRFPPEPLGSECDQECSQRQWQADTGAVGDRQEHRHLLR